MLSCNISVLIANVSIKFTVILNNVLKRIYFIQSTEVVTACEKSSLFTILRQSLLGVVKKHWEESVFLKAEMNNEWNVNFL